MAWCCQGSKTYYLDHSVFTSTRIGSWFFLVWITNRRRDIHKYRKHDNVIKWKHFPRYWSFVQGIHRSPVNSPASDTELWCFLWSAPWINGWVNNREAGDLRRHLAHYDVIVMFFFICAWTNGWVNNRDAGDLRRHRAHYDVTVMVYARWIKTTVKMIEGEKPIWQIDIAVHKLPVH